MADVNDRWSGGILDEISVRSEAREPVSDSTLGISVPSTPERTTPKNRLVTIGDSLTHGFQSGAIYNTGLSYSATIAYELGWRDFTYPRYGGPGGGLPLNIELLLRHLVDKYGKKLSLWEAPLAVFDVQRYLDQNEDYWERGDGSHYLKESSARNHALAVFGYDIRDALEWTANKCIEELGRSPSSDRYWSLVPDNAIHRAALRVFPTGDSSARDKTLLDLARDFGDEVHGDATAGIETLVVFLGANNVLPTALHLDIKPSGDDYQDLHKKNEYTIWRPSHFSAELKLLAEEVRSVKARHVIWCTVPHVTVVPVMHGVGTRKTRRGSRYFPNYTSVYIADADFDEDRDRNLTDEDARLIDSVIDEYNDSITEVVRRARAGDGDETPRDWHLLDVAGLLDRLAQRRYIADRRARPEWWTPYEMPPALADLRPTVTSEYIEATECGGRARGGLFSLDGVHPTTVGYGLIAQEMIDIMSKAGVVFRTQNGDERRGPVKVDFERLLMHDTLVSRPPANLYGGLGTLQSIYHRFPVIGRVLPH
ncbi:hypothetical protein GCM10023200_42140 [Actinomycetospora chlora]|uniref:GDSL-like lipase/acylhydrolase family protein n=1 Tax=Actinomycetospora chlora TaxID=663608 RepID=A0ABP9BV19_9PSEU